VEVTAVRPVEKVVCLRRDRKQRLSRFLGLLSGALGEVSGGLLVVPLFFEILRRGRDEVELGIEGDTDPSTTVATRNTSARSGGSRRGNS